MSASDNKKKSIPVAPVPPAGVPVNLLSSVAPPSELPNFVTASPVLQKPSVIVPVSQPVQPAAVRDNVSMDSSQQQETFSPAIPPNKGEPTLPIRSPEDTQATQSPESLPPSTPEIDKIGDIMPGSGLLTWMKGAVSTGGILQRVAEKAKSSVDTMITTLDPQMKEYLKSGGDLYIVVASDKEVKVSPIREAFQTVFGKATVVGQAAQSEVTASQPVGYAAAYAAAKQRVAHVRSTCSHLTNNVPVIAIESYLQETVSDRWYEISLVLLSQPSLGIELQLQSQSTPVPGAAVAALAAATPADYAHAQTGYALTIGSLMADSLHVPHTEWQEATTGVSRREILSLAARSLAGSYKKLLAISAAET
ncbi:protein PRRC1-like [Papilio machaon]|uniref:protein PRRC1-like n=1 Tax=Papilio machaon TaxID=76193 RepID=UPI001E665E56|nr:protein PRRC1-like [Papilio machaon]